MRLLSSAFTPPRARNSLAWCSVSYGDRISPRRLFRRLTSRSGTAPDSSIRPSLHRLRGWHHAKLFGVVLRILRRQDLAEEVIQEAYVKIWNSAGQFNPALASPITWMAPRETLWRGAPYLTATGSRRGGYSGGLRQDLEQRRTVQSGPRFTDYVDGTTRNSLAWCSVSYGDRISPRRLFRRLTSRSGTAPDSSIRPSLHRLRGWHRSRATGRSTWCARRVRPRSRRSRPRWQSRPINPIRWPGSR